MKRMVMIAAVIMLGTLSLAQTSAPATMTADLPWTEDYAAAVTRAKQDHKLLLLNFTGSDWCVPCKALDRLVFATPAFRTWAQGKFEFVTIDFPARTQQDPAIKERNQKMKDDLKVKGYPTIVILTPEGKELARTEGFEDNVTAAQWLDLVQKQMDKNTAGQ